MFRQNVRATDETVQYEAVLQGHSSTCPLTRPETTSGPGFLSHDFKYADI